MNELKEVYSIFMTQSFGLISIISTNAISILNSVLIVQNSSLQMNLIENMKNYGLNSGVELNDAEARMSTNYYIIDYSFFIPFLSHFMDPEAIISLNNSINNDQQELLRIILNQIISLAILNLFSGFINFLDSHISSYLRRAFTKGLIEKVCRSLLFKNDKIYKKNNNPAKLSATIASQVDSINPQASLINVFTIVAKLFNFFSNFPIRNFSNALTLGIASILFLLLDGYITQKQMNLSLNISHKEIELKSEFVAVIQETITNIETIKKKNDEEKKFKIIGDVIRQHNSVRKSKDSTQITLNSIFLNMMTFRDVFYTAYFAYLVIQGQMTLGEYYILSKDINATFLLFNTLRMEYNNFYTLALNYRRLVETISLKE